MKIAKMSALALVLGALTAPSLSHRAEAAPVKWQPSLAAALKTAKRTGKPVFVDFYATWCQPCHLLDKAYLESNVQKAARSYLMVKVDVDKNQDIARKYAADSLPTMLFLDSRGKVVARKVGFALPRGLTSESQAVKILSKDVVKSMKWARMKRA